MKNKFYFLIASVWISFSTIAQNPQEIHQVERGAYKSLWQSIEAIAIAVAIILGIIFARKWSKKIEKKKNDLIKKNEESKENKKK